MPIHRDAIKKTRQDARKRERNRKIISSVRTSAKKVIKALEEKNKESAQLALKEMTSLMDSAATKGVFHHNTAGRKISRLALRINHLSTK